MAHAAYSTLHYRSILQDLGDGVVLLDDQPIPPMDVYIELILSFFMILIGQLIGMGSLQPVEVIIVGASNTKQQQQQQQHRRPLAAPAYRTRNFDIYEHRGKILKSL